MERSPESEYPAAEANVGNEAERRFPSQAYHRLRAPGQDFEDAGGSEGLRAPEIQV